MNILFTSIGRRSYMIDFFKNNLSENDKVFAVNSELTYALQKADDYAICPAIYDQQYIPFLIDYCQQNQITALISLFDIDLPILAKNKNKFEEINVKLILSDEFFVGICNDKWETYNFLKENDFNVPKTYLSVDSFFEALEQNKITYPVVLKPRFGMGSIGIEIAYDEEEVHFYYKKIKRIINASYLKYESSIDLEHCILIQEKLQGLEYGLDVHNSFKGEHIMTVPKKKLAMRAGETDIAEIVKNKELIQLGANLSKVTKHIANLDVDIFKVNDAYYVLEMNARFGGQYPFSHLAGADFTKVIIDQLKNKKIDYNALKFREIKGCKDFKIEIL